jgi:asparagine synthase (glutamine-hydrolysing)
MYPNMQPQWSQGLAFPAIDFSNDYLEAFDEPNPDLLSFRTVEMARLAETCGARVLLGGYGGDMAASFRGAGHLERLFRGGRWFELWRQIGRQAQARGQTKTGIVRREVLRPLLPARVRRWNDSLRHGPSVDHSAIAPDFALRMGILEARRAEETAGDYHSDLRIGIRKEANAGYSGAWGKWPGRVLAQMEFPQPLMDRRIWEWCHRVPVGEFISGGTPRSLFRRALADVLPAEIRSRTSKGWFAPDFRQRVLGCVPAITEFLGRYPSGHTVWGYVNRQKIQDTVAGIERHVASDAWDNRFQITIVQGLRIASFVAWFRSKA